MVNPKKICNFAKNMPFKTGIRGLLYGIIKYIFLLLKRL